MNPIRQSKLITSFIRHDLDRSSLCRVTLCGAEWRGTGYGGRLFLGDDLLQFLGGLRVLLHPFVCRVALQPVRPFDLLVQRAQQVFQALFRGRCRENGRMTYLNSTVCMPNNMD